MRKPNPWLPPVLPRPRSLCAHTLFVLCCCPSPAEEIEHALSKERRSLRKGEGKEEEEEVDDEVEKANSNTVEIIGWQEPQKRYQGE